MAVATGFFYLEGMNRKTKWQELRYNWRSPDSQRGRQGLGITGRKSPLGTYLLSTVCWERKRCLLAWTRSFEQKISSKQRSQITISLEFNKLPFLSIFFHLLIFHLASWMNPNYQVKNPRLWTKRISEVTGQVGVLSTKWVCPNQQRQLSV